MLVQHIATTSRGHTIVSQQENHFPTMCALSIKVFLKHQHIRVLTTERCTIASSLNTFATSASESDMVAELKEQNSRECSLHIMHIGL
ncbi:hypothetical protein DPMN_103217 [Dreissena polymorpha]|uniref:Uncharacterized protein n=1 Tax=Dreissena polymorpha TaxID=45954 RepID=A0A9D4K2K3_DREPO|nr:hypothetical protein DPMN_103217 [Dreissena polymorpha]